MEHPNSQLDHDLRSAVRRALSSRRPLIHHLNADTSWLLQLPRPFFAQRESSRRRSRPVQQRAYYNILIDPWLAGGQSDVAAWFSQQWHVEESAVGDIEAVEHLLREIEALAGGLQDRTGDGGNTSLIDAVVISHEFTDHCHRETLMQLHPDVPAFASKEAAAVISRWNHFRVVHQQPDLTGSGADWHVASLPPLPDWVGIARLVDPKGGLYYHSAVVIAFSSPASADAEAVVYTPHGIDPPALLPLIAASPPIHPLAFLHGLHDIRIAAAQQLNLGGLNAVEVVRRLRPRYWLTTHDEVKRGGGIVSWFLRRKVWELAEVMGKKVGKVGGSITPDGEHTDERETVLKETKFVDVGNGISAILE